MYNEYLCQIIKSYIMKNLFRIIVPLLLVFTACKSDVQKGTKVEIKTSAGIITVLLYDQTPGHRDNFIKLVDSGFYDGVAFHRVIKNFMIQAGDPLTNSNLSEADKKKYEYNIPEEIDDSLFHKRGVIAAAREGDDVNPSRSSSGTQFYIVQGKKYTDSDFPKLEERIANNRNQFIYYKTLEAERLKNKSEKDTLTAEAVQQNAILKYYDIIEKSGSYKLNTHRKDVYSTVGGTPFLDGSYTIFGEVLSGMDIVDAIADTQTDITDKPVKDIKIIKAKVLR